MKLTIHLIKAHIISRQELKCMHCATKLLSYRFIASQTKSTAELQKGIKETPCTFAARSDQQSNHWTVKLKNLDSSTLRVISRNFDFATHLQ